MKLENYKNIKKSEWKAIADNFGIKYEENSGVRYLVEKIAEKIGVDDKIVSDNELKKQVVEKINSDFEIVPIDEVLFEEVVIEEVVVENAPVEKPKKSTSKKTTAKTDSKPKEPVIAKVKTKKQEVIDNEKTAEVKPVINEIPVAQLPRIEQLRLECESYGVAWSEAHSEANLEQVINGVKSAGVLPIKEMPTSITLPATSNENIATPITTPSVDTNAPFEINSQNANQIAQAVENAPQINPAFNQFATPTPPPVNGGYKTSNAYLETYRNIYINAIRNHWRVLSVAEINEMIVRDKQTFTHQINLNPQQQNKAEIILIQGDCAVRIPSDNTNEWLDING